MSVVLPGLLQEQVNDVARRWNMGAKELIVQAVERFLREGQPDDRAAEARRRLRELDKYKKHPVDDFIVAVRRARAKAYHLYLDNQDWLDAVACKGTEHGAGWVVEESERG